MNDHDRHIPAEQSNLAATHVLTVYYDGHCPLCLREIQFLRTRTPATNVAFVDFASPEFDFSLIDVDYSTLMGRLHARVDDGTWVTGVEVFRRLYAYAGLGWVVRWTRWPGFHRLAEAAYEVFARNRLRLTGRSSACEVATKTSVFDERSALDHRLSRSVRLPIGADQAFEFFADPNNLETITPTDLRFRITQAPADQLRQDSEIRYSMRLRGIPFTWHTRISEWSPGREFVDEALSSPYASWRHRHTLRPISATETEMVDCVDYRLPFSPVGELFAGMVKRELERIFDYRERMILERFRRQTIA